MTTTTHFEQAISNPPGPGSGVVHPWIMTAANYAAISKVDPNTACLRITQAMPRPPKRGEVEDAIKKAYSEITDQTTGPLRNTPRLSPRQRRQREERLRREAKERLLKQIQHKAGFTPHSFAESSPVDLGDIDNPDQQRHNAAYLLRIIHPDPASRVWMGDLQHAHDIRVRSQWDKVLTDSPVLPPRLCFNSFSPTARRREDAGVCTFTYTLMEIDPDPSDGRPTLPEQLAFIADRISHGWPITAVIDSGNKSAHALLRMDCADLHEWHRDIESDFFPRVLARWGCDQQNRNPSRMTRTPGAYNPATGRLQRLLYLNPSASIATEQPKASPDAQKPPQERVSTSNTNPHPSEPSRPSCGLSGLSTTPTATSDSTATSTAPGPDTATTSDSTRPRFTMTEQERAFLDFHLFWPHAPMY